MDNYEVKYNAALSRAKKLYEQGSITDCLGFVFPELTQSEGEKIRKELIEHIKANKDADYVLFKKFSPDDVIAWLEKQGEQKPNDNVEPKFKVGDIVQYHGGFFQITEVKWEDGGLTYCVGNDWYFFEDSLKRPDNPTVHHKVKEAFAILNNKHINFD